MASEAYKGKRVLITGGLGFIGNQLRKRLNKLGAEIFLIDHKEKYEMKVEHYSKCDIRDYSKLRSIVADISPTVVFHLAANISRSPEFAKIYDMIDVNLIGTVNLLKSLIGVASLKSIIIAGTAEEYGVNETPFKEGLKENPVSPYSFSKVCISYLCKMTCNLYRLPILILRGTLAYGPGQAEVMFIPSLIKCLLRNEKFLMTSGEQTRDFIYIDDLINAYIKVGIAKNCFGEIFNIGSGKDYRIIQVARLVASMMNKTNLLEIGAKDYRNSEVLSYRIDISKAKKILNWYPKIGIKEGLRKTIESFCKREDP